LDHYWRDLPGQQWFSGAEVFRRYVDSVTGPSVAVELGAWKGRSTSCMGVEIVNSGKPVTFYSVDHWQGSEGEEGCDLDADLRAGRLFDVFLQNIEPVASHVNVIRSDSADAALQFDDDTVDFLYIDASHTYGGIIRDLVAWLPKVKPGGLIAGDDWCFWEAGDYPVRNAVRDFFRRDDSAIHLTAGSEPNRHWLQWSVVKSPELRISSPRRLAAFRLLRLVGHTLPARAVRRAARTF
jgi:hypothetical protein